MYVGGGIPLLGPFTGRHQRLGSIHCVVIVRLIMQFFEWTLFALVADKFSNVALSLRPIPLGVSVLTMKQIPKLKAWIRERHLDFVRLGKG
jgi:hypothetical protein